MSSKTDLVISHKWKSMVFSGLVLVVIFTFIMFNSTINLTGGYRHWESLRTDLDGVAVYKERRDTLLQECYGKENTHLVIGGIKSSITVDHKHRLTYCPVPKVASSFWKRVIQVSSGVKRGHNPFDVKTPHDNSLHKLDMYPFGAAHWILQNYTSFLFVREPFSRLLACYIDKFFTTNPTFWHIGRYIIRHYRPNPSSLSLKCGHDVTFPEFIKHVISTVETKTGMDVHWKPIYILCAPCQMEYNVIGKLETISQDLKYMLNTKILEGVVFGDMENESAINRLWSNVRGLFRRYDSAAQKCMSLQETLHRLLRKEQIRGLISKSVHLSEFKEYGLNLSRGDFEKFVLDKYKEDDDKTQRKLNRKEALIEAYSQVPMEDMIKLQKLYKPDFDMFGYDPQPAELFGVNVRNGDTKKFYFS